MVSFQHQYSPSMNFENEAQLLIQFALHWTERLNEQSHWAVSRHFSCEHKAITEDLSSFEYAHAPEPPQWNVSQELTKWVVSSPPCLQTSSSRELGLCCCNVMVNFCGLYTRHEERECCPWRILLRISDLTREWIIIQHYITWSLNMLGVLFCIFHFFLMKWEYDLNCSCYTFL